MSPLKMTFPPPSLISMLWGIPASSLTKSSSNAVLAGAWNVWSTNWMSLAWTVGFAPATGEVPGSPGPPGSTGAPDAPGAGDASSPEAGGGPPDLVAEGGAGQVAKPGR